ncbi:MAG TPA: PAS domain S-box protein [Candidatus Paceibacterota bacterium]|nr:PAS domain S-box protein [Candidatus Paceibacterota bacterium]
MKLKRKKSKSAARFNPPKPPTGTPKNETRNDERLKLEEAFLLQKQLLDTRDYAEAIIEAVPPLLVLDEKLRVQTANDLFCKSFAIQATETVGRLVYELGNGQWNIPKLRTLLEDVLPRKNCFNNFEVTHDFRNIGKRTMLLSGRQVDHRQRILLFIEDITERRETQSTIRASEIRYRRLFEAARDGILILDPATRKISDANPFMSELLGYSHTELVGRELWEIGLLKDERASRKAFRELQKNHFIRYENLPLQNKSGDRHEVEFVSNLYDEDGHTVIQCNIRDITERKRTEETLRVNEERYRTLFNSIDEGFCVVEMLFDEKAKPVDYRFLEVNPSFEKQSGFHDVSGKRMRELNPDHEPNWFKVYGKVALTGEPMRFVGEVAAVKRWFDVYAFRLGGLESRKVAILFNNITERRETDEALMNAKNEIGRHALNLEQVVAKRTDELRSTIGELEGFSYSVSHDMRAPLRAMQSYAHYLIDEYGEKIDSKGLQYLRQITRSAVRLDQLIQDVLSYTRILHGTLPMGPVDLDNLVRDIVESFPNGQTIRPEFQIKGTLPNVIGNEALLAQCVSNILSNGAKFVATGTVPRMEISAEAIDAASVRVWFRDNGIGIAPENHKRIFRLFERIHPVSEYEGTGIGLTIVRKAIERMSAKVGFDSALGEGSNFWIELKKG